MTIRAGRPGEEGHRLGGVVQGQASPPQARLHHLAAAPGQQLVGLAAERRLRRVGPEVSDHDLGMENGRDSALGRPQAQVQVLVEQECTRVERTQRLQDVGAARPARRPRPTLPSPAARSARARPPDAIAPEAPARAGRSRRRQARPGIGWALFSTRPSGPTSRGTSSASRSPASSTSRSSPSSSSSTSGFSSAVTSPRARLSPTLFAGPKPGFSVQLDHLRAGRPGHRRRCHRWTPCPRPPAAARFPAGPGSTRSGATARGRIVADHDDRQRRCHVRRLGPIRWDQLRWAACR